MGKNTKYIDVTGRTKKNCQKLRNSTDFLILHYSCCDNK